MLSSPKACVFFCLTCLCAPNSHAQLKHDEQLHGDLPDFVDVTPWVTPGFFLGDMNAGHSRILGTFGTDSSGLRDSDVFTFAIPDGYQLTSLDIMMTLVSGDQGNGSYVSVAQGDSLGTGIMTATGNLDDGLVSFDTDLLNFFSTGEFTPGLAGINAFLAADVYTFGLHETTAVIDYQLDFQVTAVPLPPAILFFISALASLFLAGKRKTDNT
ncbi:MAG: hypothetical protein AAF353_13625 [Pseudomonadota bacterium]